MGSRSQSRRRTAGTPTFGPSTDGSSSAMAPESDPSEMNSISPAVVHTAAACTSTSPAAFACEVAPADSRKVRVGFEGRDLRAWIAALEIERCDPYVRATIQDPRGWHVGFKCQRFAQEDVLPLRPHGAGIRVLDAVRANGNAACRVARLPLKLPLEPVQHRAFRRSPQLALDSTRDAAHLRHHRGHVRLVRPSRRAKDAGR